MPADSRLCAHDVEHRRALAGERRCLHVAAGWAVQSTGVQAATLLQQLLGGCLQLEFVVAAAGWLLLLGCCGSLFETGEPKAAVVADALGAAPSAWAAVEPACTSQHRTWQLRTAHKEAVRRIC